jgi:hypothetical protein
MSNVNEQDSSHKHAPDALAASSVNDEPPSKRAKLDSLTPAAAPAVDDGAAAPPSAVATVAAAATASPLSAAQRCDQDSLSIVFSFCQFISYAAAAAQTCRSWYAAATLRQNSCHATMFLNLLKRPAFLEMLQSPLRVHLSCVWLRNARGNDVLQLHARCPQLEELTVQADGPSLVTLTDSAADVAAFNPHAWPSLRSLHRSEWRQCR